jgi:hypothetical protein
MKALAKRLVILAVVLSCGNAFAQIVTGTLVGRVTDQSGAVVAGVKITILNAATGLSRTVATDESGDYIIPLLPAGEYRLAAEQTGFKQSAVSDIKLEVAQKARVDLVLTVGASTESITVRADAQVLQTDSSDIGMVVDNHEMVDIPLNGRKLLDLNLLDAGTARLSNFRNDAAGSRSQNLGGAGTSSNGTSVDGNNYLVDGLQNQGMQTTHMSYQPTLESVQEFKQQSSQYDAASGFGGGAQINVITKSGSNSFHGEAYEYLRNDILDAKNYFDTTKPKFRLNQFGGVFGGPIIKKHTFFFFSYEGTRIRQSQTQLFSVPSDVQRGGDFTGAATIYDPNTTRPDPANPGQFIRDPFPNNIIPANRIDLVAQKALQLLIPFPNLPGISQNLRAAPLRTENSNQYSIRVDHHFNNSHTIFGRYTKYTNEKILNSFAKLPSAFDFVNNPASNLTFGYTAVLSTKMVNELRVGWSTWNQVLEPTDGRLGTKIDWHGTLGLATPPNSLPEITLGQPDISIAGYGSTGGQLGAPNNRNDNNYQVVDNFSFTAGNHQMSFGGATHLWRENHAGINLFARGFYIVTSQYTSLPGAPGTGNSLADFLLGFPSVTLAGEGFSSNPYGRNFGGGYFQDNWNIRPSLTLNLGLRYEYFGPWYNPNENLTFFSFPRAQFVSTSGITADGLPKSSYTVSKDNVAPRIGFAWRPFGNNKTVVRSGFGMFHMTHTQLYELLGLNPNPTSRFVTWIGDPNVPNLTLENAFPPALGSLGTPNGYAVQPHWKTPYNMQWSLFVEREVMPGVALEVGYIGNRGISLEQAPDINTPLPGPGPLNSRRQFPNIGSLNESLAAGDSWYHAFQMNVERKWRSGFSFKVSYAFSKGLSDVDLGAFAFQGGLGFKQNPFNFGAQKGRSEFDARHRFVVSYIYELPFGRGKRFWSGASGVANGIVGGWQVNGVTIYQTGTPVDTSLAVDNAGTGGAGADDRPDLIGNPNNGPKTPLEWFNTAAFVLPPAGRYGNARRNIIDAPGISNFDFSLFKNFRITEKQQLQFRTEVFNLFNHPQFDPPSTVFGTSSFGRISSAGDGRQIQVALKYNF